MIKAHTFNGVTYDVHIGAIDGMCDPPKQEGSPNFIIAEEPKDTLKFLETLIHEAMHACHYSCQEERVELSARDIARLLRRMGYRLKEK